LVCGGKVSNLVFSLLVSSSSYFEPVMTFLAVIGNAFTGDFAVARPDTFFYELVSRFILGVNVANCFFLSLLPR